MTPEEALSLARTVRELSRDPEGLRPSLVLCRGGEQVARVMLSGDTRRYLEAAAIAIPGFGADQAMLIVEGYACLPEPFRKEFGRWPEGGDAERLFKAGRKDLATELINVTWVDREAQAWSCTQPFVAGADGSVLWREVQDVFGGKELDGDVPRVLRKVMGRLNEARWEMTAEQRARLDSHLGRSLAEAGFPTLLFPHDAATAAIYEEEANDA